MTTKKDVQALNGGDVPENAGPASVADPSVDASAPMDTKVVDHPSPPEPEVLTEEQEIARYGYALRPKEPFVSEGMRHDIVTFGFAIDPVSGQRVERA
jgi:hypothetical protein